MDATWQQLEDAALCLARGGTIKDRLVDAYRNHLSQVDIEDLPQCLREELRACNAALTREPPLRGEDAVRATVRKLSSVEADQLAGCVVRLYGATLREAAQAQAAQLNQEPVPNDVVIGTVNGTGRAKVLRHIVSPVSIPQVIEIGRYAAEA